MIWETNIKKEGCLIESQNVPPDFLPPYIPYIIHGTLYLKIWLLSLSYAYGRAGFQTRTFPGWAWCRNITQLKAESFFFFSYLVVKELWAWMDERIWHLTACFKMKGARNQILWIASKSWMASRRPPASKQRLQFYNNRELNSDSNTNELGSAVTL